MAPLRFSAFPATAGRLDDVPSRSGGTVRNACPGRLRGRRPPGGQARPGAAVEIEDDERRNRLAARYRAHAAFGTQRGLGRIGADQAYARLAIQHREGVRPGAGVTVGLVDTGVDKDHPAFADTRIDEVFLPGSADETDDFPLHGTAVDSVIAAGPGSPLPDAAHGMAWGADLVMFADAGFSEPPDPPPEIEELPTEYFPVWSDGRLGWLGGSREPRASASAIRTAGCRSVRLSCSPWASPWASSARRRPWCRRKEPPTPSSMATSASRASCASSDCCDAPFPAGLRWTAILLIPPGGPRRFPR